MVRLTVKKREEALRQLVAALNNLAKNMHTNPGLTFGNFCLSRQQIALVFLIANNSSLTARDLSQMIQVTPGAITQFVNSLVKKGLVEREVDRNDRRLMILKLSPLAKREFRCFEKEYFRALNRAFGAFNDQELGRFTALIGKIKNTS